MSSLPTTAVTGSTGFVGGAVARSLAADGTPLRLLVRDLSRAPQLPGAVALQSTYAQTPAEALAGVETLLMVSAAENESRRDEHFAFVDAATAAGVKHIVYTSFVGASPDCTFTLGRDHFATEQRIIDSGMDYTFLRDNFYADFMPMMMGEGDVIRGPAGDGRAAIVTRADVARVATTVLSDVTAHRGATYNLTGSEALTMAEVAAVISEVRGISASFYDETLAEAYESRQKWNAPDWQVDAWVSTYTAIANGELQAVSPDIERVTGRPATSLAEFLRAEPTA
jgi:uncharacterized protein YbjT (DUF2867 family)